MTTTLDPTTTTTVAVDRADLANGLGWATRALAQRATNPILTGVRVKADGDTLTVSATDFEQSAQARIELTTGGDFDLVVPGRLFADLVKSLPGGSVELTATATTLQVAAGRTQFVLPVMPLTEYPAMPDVPAAAGTLDGETFADAARRVVPAAGRDDSLPVLTGVRVELDPDTAAATLVATDRYRLAEVVMDYTPATGAQPFTGLVAAKTLDSYGKSGDGVTVSWHGDSSIDSHLTGVSAAEKSATTRMLAGQFPDYRKLLASVDPTATAVVPVADVIDAVKRVALVLERTDPIRLTITDGQLSIQAGSSLSAAGADVVENVSLTGVDQFEIAFNPAYLIDGLNAIGTDTATWLLVDSMRPMLMTNETAESRNVKLRYLLMPVRLPS